jgi:photosystem II stability/assembly factor-like uncharacterized protein
MSISRRSFDRAVSWGRAAKLGLLLVALATALLLCAPAMAYLPPGSGWESMPQEDFLHIYGVAFDDAAHGWIVGDDYDAASMPAQFAAIAATVDGGSTWVRQVPGTFAILTAVATTDASHAWAVGLGGTIVATANGGVTWTPQVSGKSADLNGVSFADALHGCAVGDCGVILTTANGGALWTPRASGTTADLMGVSFPDGDSLHGWAIGRSYAGGYTSVVLATTDGGLTWPPQLAGVPDELTGVSFPDANHGWTVTFGGVVYSTDDGGATWTDRRMTRADNHPVAIVFPDAAHGWAVGGTEIEPWGTLIWATANGGVTWKLQNKGGGPEQGMDAIAFPDLTHGYAVGEAGCIMRTRTGGVPPVTLKLAGLSHGAMSLGHRVTASGVVTPAGAAGDRVRLTVQKKRGANWVAATSVTRNQQGAGLYQWKYRPSARGTYRIKAAVGATAGHPAATTTWSQFKVK